MATVGLNYPQLIDMYKGSAEGAVVELLKINNPIMEDAIVTSCNMDTIHRHTIRTGYPDVTWGRLYKGVKASKATMQQVDDTTGFLETRSEIDTRLLELASDPARQRLIDSAPYLDAMNQEMATGFFYHDTATTPEKFKGLAARYNVYNTNPPNPSAPNIANQVIHGGGSGSDNTSIWFVTWADHATSLLAPKGVPSGIRVRDRGEEAIRDADGATYYSKVTTFEWHLGAFVKDYRYNARIANIDVSDARDGKVDLWALLRKAYYRLVQTYPIGSAGGRTVIYMNRDILETLDAQSSDRSLINNAGTYNYTAPGLSQAQVEGKLVQSYRGLPIRVCDSILNTEALVTGVSV